MIQFVLSIVTVCEARHLLALRWEGDTIPLLHGLNLDSHPVFSKSLKPKGPFSSHALIICDGSYSVYQSQTLRFRTYGFFIGALHKYDYILDTFELTGH